MFERVFRKLPENLASELNKYLSQNYVPENSGFEENFAKNDGIQGPSKPLAVRAVYPAEASKPKRPARPRVNRGLEKAARPKLGNVEDAFVKTESEEEILTEFKLPNAKRMEAPDPDTAGGIMAFSVDASCEPMPSCSPTLKQRSLEDVVNNLEKSFMEIVYSFADARGMSDLEVRKRAALDKRTFSKLKCGNTKNPSKNTALALAIALYLNLDETKDLLARAGMALSPCSKTDMIVKFFIENEAYDIFLINDALYEHGEPPLGSLVTD